jgi:hypothetical protein
MLLRMETVNKPSSTKGLGNEREVSLSAYHRVKSPGHNFTKWQEQGEQVKVTG